jgi:hypothetical protein
MSRGCTGPKNVTEWREVLRSDGSPHGLSHAVPLRVGRGLKLRRHSSSASVTVKSRCGRMGPPAPSSDAGAAGDAREARGVDGLSSYATAQPQSGYPPGDRMSLLPGPGLNCAARRRCGQTLLQGPGAGRYSAAGQVKARSSEEPQLRWEFGDQVMEVEDGLVGDAEAS